MQRAILHVVTLLASISIYLYLRPTPSPNILVSGWAVGRYILAHSLFPLCVFVTFTTPRCPRTPLFFLQWLEIPETMHVHPMTDFKFF